MYSIEMALLYAQARQRDFIRQADEHRRRKRLSSEQSARPIWRRNQFRLPVLLQSGINGKLQEPACTTC